MIINCIVFYNCCQVITNRVTEGNHARWEIDDLKVPNVTDLLEDDVSDGNVGSCEPVSSCIPVGGALHPSMPSVADTDNDNVEQDHVIWRIMSFFENYADLQVIVIVIHQ